jgi:beta-galactosidase/beta-glucuronidase
MVRPDWLNLNGWWDFALDLSNSGEERGMPQGEGFDKKILVPFAPESKLSGIGFLDFMDVVWYKRTLILPDGWEGRRVLLHFEAVDYKATVWINGKKAGEHTGGYTPFSLDITDFLQPGENLLVVKALDDLRSGLQPLGKQCDRLDSYSCLYRRTTGIWQSVWVEPVADIRVEKYKIYPAADNGEADILVYLNTDPAHGDLALKVFFKGQEKFSSKKRAERVVSFNAKIKDAELWGVRAPNLYDIEISFQPAEGPGDRIKGYFGLRNIAVRGQRIFLNNKPLFLRMVLDQGFYPDGIYTAPSDDALRNDIKISQGLGFDGARLHQRVFERRFLYWADRMGYLVWGEYADWGLDLSRSESYMIFTREWGEAIERDFNHPAIIGWCPLNERYGDSFPGAMENIFGLTKLLDPTRIAIDSSGGYHLAVPDVYDSHNYDQDTEDFKDAYDGMLQMPPKVYVTGDSRKHTPYKGQPYFVSEYGGIWWNPGQQDEKAWGYGKRPEDAQEFIERYKKLTEVLLFNPAVAGFCYTQLYDIEQEVNGLYTFDRKPKFDPAIFKAINQQKAAIEN